jgi:hypothetical protein
VDNQKQEELLSVFNYFDYLQIYNNFLDEKYIKFSPLNVNPYNILTIDVIHYIEDILNDIR